MKDSAFKLFQTLHVKEEILDLNELLNKKGIETKLVNSSLGITGGAEALGASSVVTYALHIKDDDFKIANKLLEEEAIKQVDSISKDHYLYGFTDEELYDILQNQNEWNHLDYALAKKILKERGKEINTEDLKQIIDERETKLRNKSESPNYVIFIGYTSAIGIPLLGIFILPYLYKNAHNSLFKIFMTWWAIVGTPIAGMWIANYLTRNTKTYNGEIVYFNDNKTVASGKVINILSWMFFIFYLFMWNFRY
tara:strand:- start:801 stop:1556 length:756 start_codon:yes stop_codon:yes gene_type:complete